MPLSKEMKKNAAIEAVSALMIIEEINAFIEGDDRSEVIAAAQIRTQELEGAKPKQGEQPGPITQQTADFKGGIEGAKAAPPEILTGSHIVEAIDKADEKRVNAAERRDAEAKAAADKAALSGNPRKPEDVVTCEDVIKTLREKGVKI